MHRLIVNLLVALALLMQAGSGVLAIDSACCREAKAPVKCCCADKASKSALDQSRRHPQRDRCICAASAETRATPVAGPRTVSVPSDVAVAPLVAPADRCFVITRCAELPYARVNESPPNIARAVSLPLLL